MKIVTSILEELHSVCQHIAEKEYKEIVQLFQKDGTFYFAGEGRSGLIAKAIAMRLMHTGKQVYVVGETTTPAIGEKDILILISGSGKTNQTVHIGNSAANCGAFVFLVTANKEAIHHSWCSAGMHIPAATKHQLPSEPKTIQPMGNQFDQAVHILLDAAIVNGLESTKKSVQMKKRHSNLE